MYELHLPPVYTVAATFTMHTYTSTTSNFTTHDAMIGDLATSRSTHACAHHNNAMTGWGYVLYRPPLPSNDIPQEHDDIYVTSVASKVVDYVSW